MNSAELLDLVWSYGYSLTRTPVGLLLHGPAGDLYDRLAAMLDSDPYRDDVIRAFGPETMFKPWRGPSAHQARLRSPRTTVGTVIDQEKFLRVEGTVPP
jgi:hypothetical protein